MGKLVCPYCEPLDPVKGDEYYPIEQTVLTDKDGIVGRDGHVRRSDHTYGSLIVYAECLQSVEDLMEDV